MRSGHPGFTAEGKEPRRAGTSPEKMDISDPYARKPRVACGLQAFPGKGCGRPGKVGQIEMGVEPEQAVGDLRVEGGQKRRDPPHLPLVHVPRNKKRARHEQGGDRPPVQFLRRPGEKPNSPPPPRWPPPPRGVSPPGKCPAPPPGPVPAHVRGDEGLDERAA